ncbi:hypothetical protein UFOVP672_47 [uncultured Caudovirales phage]|uniref:Uncharacterized protein n=1 Tax=uncultured Caudovirales phage TaxID=2100421 RepID=A0A6J5NE73_9CAUD|nr:hypothetical protein UFOVP672_47 [uncultured Caudovirales phage]
MGIEQCAIFVQSVGFLSQDGFPCSHVSAD